MSELVPLLAGAVVAGLMAPGTLRTFAENGWTRENHRGRALPFPGGVVAVAAALVATGALAALDELAGTELLTARAARTECDDADAHCLSRDALAAIGPWVLPMLAGVAFLGLADDLLDAAPRGLRGHGAALLGGRFSTGALKAAGTVALACVVLSRVGFEPAEYLLAVAVVVLATNAFNLLDLRPGRSAKALVLVAGACLLGTWDAGPLRPLGAFAGALLVLGAFDVREKTMLGDTGANVMGAVAGLWVVLSLGAGGQLVVLALLLALTAYGELRSISAAVDRIPPLRAVDRLGRPR